MAAGKKKIGTEIDKTRAVIEAEKHIAWLRNIAQNRIDIGQ